MGILTVFFMVSPMYVENATFAWTKLPTVFFILTALYFFLRACDRASYTLSSVLFALTLASALLTHYSAGPFAVASALAWISFGRLKQYNQLWWRNSLCAILAGTLTLAPWFGWAFSVYGSKGTLLTNTSITDKAPNALDQLLVVMLNIRDTVVPHFLRHPDLNIIAQKNSSGWWRDWFFILYQTNLFFIFGSVAWIGIIVLIVRKWRSTTSFERTFWLLFVTTATVLGLVVIGSQYNLGLAHICLQPLVILGLTFLAAYWPTLPRPWQLTLIAGATVDFSIGILLQFGTQAFIIDRWLQSEVDPESWTAGNGPTKP